MNKNKLALTSAILSIIGGAISLPAAYQAMVGVAGLDYYYYDSSFRAIAMIFLNIIYLSYLTSIALIVFGGILCKMRASKAFVITLTALTATTALLFVMSSLIWFDTFVFLVLLLIIAALIFLIITLCKKDDGSIHAAAAKVPAATAAAPAPAPAVSQIDETQKKINLLKQLRFDDQLTDEEYKTLLMKELEK